MRIFSFCVTALPVLAVLAYANASDLARASTPHEYRISPNDGYGLEDCLAAGNECGRVVADAWCEAHGDGRALAYGPQGAAESRATQVSAADDESYVIKCGE